MTHNDLPFEHTGVQKVSLLILLCLWIKLAAVNVKLWNGKTQHKGNDRKRKKKEFIRKMF